MKNRLIQIDEEIKKLQKEKEQLKSQLRMKYNEKLLAPINMKYKSYKYSKNMFHRIFNSVKNLGGKDIFDFLKSLDVSVNEYDLNRISRIVCNYKNDALKEFKRCLDKGYIWISEGVLKYKWI